jgi:hypothetical protein
LRIRGDIHEAAGQAEQAVADFQAALARDPFQKESRAGLERLAAEVPPEPGEVLGEPAFDWVVREVQPGRFIATHPKYPRLRAELEMFGDGKPKILDWSLMKNQLSGIGLLRYYAGDSGEEIDATLEYTAIVDLHKNKVVSIEPNRVGSQTAQWQWQEVSVVITDTEGNANEIKLRAPKPRPVAQEGWDPFSGRRGGGGAGFLDWLFR